MKANMDEKGRILIHKELRHKTSLKGNEFVEDKENHLILSMNK